MKHGFPDSPDFYRHIFESASDAIVLFRPESEEILEANPKACELYGFTRDELIGMDLRQLSHAPALGRRAIARVMRDGKLDGYESTQYRKDGSNFRLQCNATLFEYQGAPAILAVGRDVTAQRRAELEIFKSEQQYRLMFESNPQPMWIFDLETFRFLAVNEATIRHYGYSRDQFLSMTVLDIRPEDEKRRFVEEVDQSPPFRRHEGTWAHRTADGRVIHVRAASHKFIFEGRPARFVMVQDVTEELRARHALAEREEYYRTLIENSQDLITVIDANGIVQYDSPSVETIVGRQPEQVIGRSVFDNVHPEDAAAARNTFQDGEGAFSQTRTLEVRLRSEDGTWRTLEAVGNNLLHEPAIRGIVINSRDITERRQAEEALRRSERRLRLAQRAGRIGTWEYNVRTASITVGPIAAELLTGEARGEMGNEWISFVHPDDLAEVREELERMASEFSPVDKEYRVVWQDGTIHWVSSKGEYVCGANGVAEGFIGVLSDVTERKRFEEALGAARDQALAASKMQQQFLATVSHEIRTPMNGIIGMTGLLLDSELAEEQRADAETIRTSALYLLELINDLLDFSRIEAGKIAVDKAPFNLRGSLETVIDLLSHQAAEKSLNLSLHYPTEMPLMFSGNAGRLRQIVLNFAANAVKFTDHGSVRIEVEPLPAGRVKIRVFDTGPGIAIEAQRRMFQKFSQVDSSPTRRHGGTGLGLAISKSLAEVMGGQVGVNSKPGEGSEFWVELPLEATLAEEASLPEPQTCPPDIRYTARVLVAEDNKVNQRVAVRMLERRGIRTDVASDGREAIEMWAQFPYDLVLMDCHMPEVDGYEATRRIRASERPNTRVPIVAVTASAHNSDKARCLESGMDAVLTKPFHLHELDAVLEDWLGGKVTRDRIEAQSSDIQRLSNATARNQSECPAAPPK